MINNNGCILKKEYLKKGFYNQRQVRNKKCRCIRDENKKLKNLVCNNKR